MSRYKFSLIRLAFKFILFAFLIAAANGSFRGVLAGDLSSSLLFSTVPLSDPFAVLSLAFAGANLGASAVLGAVIVAAFYAIIAPRAFCAWVCPVGLITELTAKIRRKLKLNESGILNIKRTSRYYILASVLLLSAIFSVPVFESVSFIGVVQRGLIFGGFAWLGVAFLIVVFELFILPNGTCGHICPLGAFYSILSTASIFRIKHHEHFCTYCSECERVCPEKQVLSIIGEKSGFVKSSECISCGLCIDACEENALEFSIKNLRRKNEN
ncbi:quinol dehydrogenase ferredoxin subunit NapH [Campylobacter sp. 19-13652]|uniref:quinol dehydrogenase ferredoxin subunit NapH n=1 Tax=Campylobacter sp. 19-13652 TaxID=2840180 RepID=UPI001C78004E|nr:quinol dehydrogenase ferredoxin subunit NapH [Campylobacter sp. 19-13652]BCX79687.1 quinol dehydrogenase [Campylobacter sp. 19-13652]